jgi:hypothetical protein
MSVQTIGCGTQLATLSIQSVVDSSLVAVLKMCVDIHNGNKSTGSLYSFCRRPKMAESFGDHYKVNIILLIVRRGVDTTDLKFELRWREQ